MRALNLCQHSTTDLARGTITNERKQSALSKTRSNILKRQAAFWYHVNLLPTSR